MYLLMLFINSLMCCCTGSWSDAEKSGCINTKNSFRWTWNCLSNSTINPPEYKTTGNTNGESDLGININSQAPVSCQNLGPVAKKLRMSVIHSTSAVISLVVRPVLVWVAPGIITHHHTIITGLYDHSTWPPPHQMLVLCLSCSGHP